MSPSAYSLGNNRCARAGGNSRREFLSRTITIGSGPLLAATMVLGNELRLNANQAESQTDFSLGNPSSDARVTTADLMVDKLGERLSTMAFALSFVIAAKLAYQGRRCVGIPGLLLPSNDHSAPSKLTSHPKTSPRRHHSR